jgi:acylphosphatase
VEVYAVGTETELETFRTELRRGPAGASVSYVEVEKTVVESEYSVEFSIEYSD